MSDTPKEFYVYVHKYASGPKKGHVFYVGKGKGKRHLRRSGRNQHWERIVDKYGYTSCVLLWFSKEDCAFSLEVAMISFYGRSNLCNMTDGGEGLRSPTMETREFLSMLWRGSKSPRFDHTVYKFKNIDGMNFEGTRYELRSFGVNENQITNMVAGRMQHCKGWYVEGNEPKPPNTMRGRRHYALDARIIRFKNISGEEYIGIRYDFCKKYGLKSSPIGGIINKFRKDGKMRTFKGWSASEI